MGRRKRATKVIKTQKKAIVAKVFKCIHCKADSSVEVKLERKKKTAFLKCTQCGSHFTSEITYLSEPVDVFYEWVDKTQAEEERMYQEQQEAEESDEKPARVDSISDSDSE